MTEVAVIIEFHDPKPRNYKPSDYCKLAVETMNVYLIMVQNDAKLWRFDELAKETGYSVDKCRRIIYSMCMTTIPVVMEGDGGWRIADSIRRFNTNYISSLRHASLVAERRAAMSLSGEN